jgi:hypothetical protein
MQTRDLEPYRVFWLGGNPGIGFVIPEHEPIPPCLRQADWIPMGQTLLPRVPVGPQASGSGTDPDRDETADLPFSENRE